MTSRKIINTRKVTINLPIELYQELEKRYYKNGTSITTEIIMALRTCFNQEQAIQLMPDILKAYQNEQKLAKKPKTKTR